MESFVRELPFGNLSFCAWVAGGLGLAGPGGLARWRSWALAPRVGPWWWFGWSVGPLVGGGRALSGSCLTPSFVFFKFVVKALARISCWCSHIFQSVHVDLGQKCVEMQRYED